jgi:hypothetical protein
MSFAATELVEGKTAPLFLSCNRIPLQGRYHDRCGVPPDQVWRYKTFRLIAAGLPRSLATSKLTF